MSGTDEGEVSGWQDVEGDKLKFYNKNLSGKIYGRMANSRFVAAEIHRELGGPQQSTDMAPTLPWHTFVLLC